MDLIDYRRKIIANSPHLSSASGAVASFSDGEDLPLNSLNVNIEPVQSGTGDPSPSNIRPISGWNGVNLTRCGKNLLALPFVYYTGVSTDLSNYFFVKAGTYVFSFSASTASSWRFIVRLKDLDGNVISDSQHNPSNTLAYRSTLNGYTNGGNTTEKELVLNIAEDCYIRILHWMTANPQTDTFNDCKLEEGSTATPYEPYNGVTVTVDLGQTVYGGTLNPLTGVLTVDKVALVIDGVGIKFNNVYKYGTLNRFGVQYPTGLAPKYTGSTSYCISDKLTPSYICTIAINTTRPEGYYCFPHTSALFVSMPSSVISGENTSEANAWAETNRPTVCYELDTPYTIQLTPRQVRSLYGNNTIFADTGNVALEYWAHA